VLTEKDFLRFNVYAPFVKHLDAPLDLEMIDLMPGCAGLIRYAETHVLLPRLISITFDSSRVAGSQLAWFFAFLSPSLLSLELVINNTHFPSGTSILAASALLHALSDKCPNLRKLALFPTPAEGTHDEDRKVAQLVASSKGFSNVDELVDYGLGASVANNRSIVSLTTSSQMLDESFLTIKAWSSLERLEVHMDPNENDPMRNLAIVPFPSLKHLGLYYVPEYDVLLRFWDMPALVSNLTSIRLHLGRSFLADPRKFELLSIVAERSPCIENLWLSALNPDFAYHVYEIPVSTLKIVTALPLRSLYLEPIAFIGCDHMPEFLTTTFPRLKELGLPAQRMSLRDLGHFAWEMPHLEYLSMNFKLCSLNELDDDLSNVLRHRRSVFRTLEGNFHGIVENIPGNGIEREAVVEPDFGDFTYQDVIRLVQ
jgi:hypothetical protein